MVKSAAVADRDGKRHTNLVTVAGGGAHGDGQNGEHALQPACMGMCGWEKGNGSP